MNANERYIVKRYRNWWYVIDTLSYKVFAKSHISNNALVLTSLLNSAKRGL